MRNTIGWKIFGLFVSIFMIIGGFSGEFVLRGTESSTALVVVGFGFLAWDIFAIATHDKSKKKNEEKAAELEIDKAELEIDEDEYDDALPSEPKPELLVESNGRKMKSRKVALILASIPYTGLIGIDRFYLGYIGLGILKLLTCGGGMIWYIIDIVRIKNGTEKDNWGRPLLNSIDISLQRDGCKSIYYDKVRDEHHDWHGCKCADCGKIRNAGHTWNDSCKCSVCGKTRDEGHLYVPVVAKYQERCSICGKLQTKPHQFNGENCKICGESNPNIFKMIVCNKFTAYGGLFAEGKEGKGTIKVGDRVFVYSEKGNLKYDGVTVAKLMKDGGITVQSVTIGDDKTYAEIMLNGVRNVGDIDYKDIISKQKIDFKPVLENKPTTKQLPEPKTYNNPDRKKHIDMATNDLSGMAASGSLLKNREWVRNVAQDLYDAHGFSAMQEVFINVKTRYPEAQSQLSPLWDGVGGWAD